MTSAESNLVAGVTGKPKPAVRRRRIHWRTVGMHAIIIFFCLIVLLPILWVLLLSFKSLRDAYTGKLWPDQFDFTHYTYVFQRMPSVLRNFSNSIIVTLTTVVVTTVIAILAGYALVHTRLTGAAIMGAALLATLFFPTRLVSIVGIFQIQFGLSKIIPQIGINTLPGLMLPYITLNLALSIMIMRGIFQQISPELVDAAKIDGASSWRTLREIILPLAANGIVVVGMINFVTAWGEYLLARTLMNDKLMQTFPVALTSTFSSFGEWAMPRVAAMYIMAIAPGIIAFAFLQRWYMKGLQEGALKF
jgi:ABC-type glycerol-3-phosphate transport system permease component